LALNVVRNQKLPNYLRLHRKRLGLTQSEMAFLLGFKSSARISRYERFRRQPDFDTALRYKATFGVGIGTLFPGLFAKARTAVKARSRRLITRLSRVNTALASQKVQALTTVHAALTKHR
jgi:transcriptional regulator with XRE-family HTH domain